MQEMQVVPLYPLSHTFPLMEVGGGRAEVVMGFLNLLGILAAETVLRVKDMASLTGDVVDRVPPL